MVVLVSPLTVVERVAVVVLSHARCSASEIRWLSEDETQALVHDDGEATDSVSAAASLLSSPAGDRPVPWVSFHAEVSTSAESGDLVNAITAARLKAGWELVTQFDANPVPRPTDIRCQFTPLSPVDPLTGLVAGRLVMTVEESLLADIGDMEIAEQWLTSARRTGEFALYLGPLNVHRWITGLDVEAIERALGAGHLVGCMAPLEISAA